MKTIIKDFKKLETALADSEYQSRNRLKNHRKFKVINAKQAVDFLHKKYKDNPNYSQCMFWEQDIKLSKEQYRQRMIYQLGFVCSYEDNKLLQKASDTLKKYLIA